MPCQDYKKCIHEYLDEELSQCQTKQLFQHIDQCEACQKHLHELEKTILLLKSHSHLKAPEYFTEKVMQQLPKEAKGVKAKRWMKGHPFLVAASLFIFLMAGSLLTIWTEGQDQFYVSTPHMDQLVVDQESGTVIVPEGKVIQGDLIVRNGDVEVRGEVTGDVIVTDGQVYLASTAHIVGQVEEIDQFLKWTWYHLRNWVKDAIQFEE
jgi:anti-sigma factor RsiW